jgi:hypothetical protein
MIDELVTGAAVLSALTSLASLLGYWVAKRKMRADFEVSVFTVQKQEIDGELSSIRSTLKNLDHINGKTVADIEGSLERLEEHLAMVKSEALHRIESLPVAEKEDT